MGSVCSTKKEKIEVADEGPPVEDKSANGLSYVGDAAYQVLRTKHKAYHKKQWNFTKSKMVGSLQQTPSASIFETDNDPAEGHSDWFAEKMCEIVSRTTKFCDIMSLAAPDGYFLEQVKRAIENIVANNEGKSSEPIIVRLMFGNIIALPINCERLIKKLTKDIPVDANIQIWVGAWRKGTSWNHAKLIAVDGRYLHTGGHNMWSDVYLKDDPVHDVSIEMEGPVAHDAHNYADEHWEFIKSKQSTFLGQILENVPDFLPLASKTRVIISEYPKGKATEFAPYYHATKMPVYDFPEASVPVVSVGRQGTLVQDDRPADDAFVAMIDASKKIIRMSLQDVGPVTLPAVKIPLPSLGWPDHYLNALARAIWLRGVDVEIVLTNEDAKSGYSNGWDCNDVGSEIIKRIEKQFPTANDAVLRQKVEDNLRICYIRHGKSFKFKSGVRIGNHTKYFIVDDLISYTGSQNLYDCDLAEWGVLIDDAEVTDQMIQDYWNPMWEASFVESDCDTQKVMDGLKIDRDGESVDKSSSEGKRKIDEAITAIARAQLPPQTELYDEE